MKIPQNNTCHAIIIENINIDWSSRGQQNQNIINCAGRLFDFSKECTVQADVNEMSVEHTRY